MGHEPESQLQGLFREYQEKNKAELHVSYEKAFALFRKADRLLLAIMDEIHPTNDEQAEATTAHRCEVLCLRFYKAMRSAYLLIENDCTVDAFSSVRNMMECYLALSSLLKDEKVFFEVIKDDLFKAREGIFKHVDTTGLRNDLDEESKEILQTKREEYRTLKENGKTFNQLSAYKFYCLTKDESDSEYIYFLYRYISNMFSHISSHSLSVDIKDNDGRLRYGGITRKEMNAFITYAIKTFFLFGRRLDKRFLNDKYKTELLDMQSGLIDFTPPCP